MSVPEPNSPEAKRAAERIRTTFFLIAAANVVIIAIVMWPKGKPAAPAEKPVAEKASVEPGGDLTAEKAAATSPAFAEMSTVNERVIAAYHAKDAERFAAEFSPNAVPPVTEDYFRKVVVGVYQEEFGDITGRKLTGETSLDPNYGMLVFEITCKKGIRAKISANFRREGDALKVVQWRMEKM